MRRRTYLLGCAGATAALAGCSALGGDGDDSGDGGTSSADEEGADGTSSSDDDGGDADSSEEATGPSGPAETARAFYEAIIDGEKATANGLLHSKSTPAEIGDSLIEMYQSADATVDGATLVSTDDDVATVHVELNLKTTSGDRTTRTMDVGLRTENDEWRVYGEDDSGSTMPTVSWNIATTTNADGHVTTVAFTHESGQSIDPATLSVSVGGSEATAPESATELTAGDTIVATLAGDGSGVDAGAPALLVWNAPDSGQSAPVATIDLESEAAGSLASPFEIEG